MVLSLEVCIQERPIQGCDELLILLGKDSKNMHYSQELCNIDGTNDKVHHLIALETNNSDLIYAAGCPR